MASKSQIITGRVLTGLVGLFLIVGSGIPKFLDWPGKDEMMSNHHPDLVIFDVLLPMKYESSAAYRASWGEWQPETNCPGVFELQNLEITAGIDVAFAHAFIRCGGTTPKDKSFEDTVRATFCLQRIDSRWYMMHQHVSKPYGQS